MIPEAMERMELPSRVQAQDELEDAEDPDSLTIEDDEWENDSEEL